jgi:thiosulfate/3-mercaptopyruvate sulfurtransferase
VPRFCVTGHALTEHVYALRVAVLDGGLGAWRAQGFRLDLTPPSETAAKGMSQAAANPTANPAYLPAMKKHLVKNMAEVRAALQDDSIQVVDARPSGRFRGIIPEPREDVPSGHMPGK